MNDLELAQFLARVAVADNRQVDAFVLAHWRPLIGDLELQDAVDALVMHSRESTDYLMPAHIRQNVERVQRDLVRRANDFMRKNSIPSGLNTPRNFEHRLRIGRALDNPAELATRIEEFHQAAAADYGFAHMEIAPKAIAGLVVTSEDTRRGDGRKPNADAWMNR